MKKLLQNVKRIWGSLRNLTRALLSRVLKGGGRATNIICDIATIIITGTLFILIVTALMISSGLTLFRASPKEVFSDESSREEYPPIHVANAEVI